MNKVWSTAGLILSLFGAAILAGVGAGAWATVEEACQKAIQVVETFEPQAASADKLQQNYEAYKLLYAGLRAAMKIITKS